MNFSDIRKFTGTDKNTEMSTIYITFCLFPSITACMFLSPRACQGAFVVFVGISALSDFFFFFFFAAVNSTAINPFGPAALKKKKFFHISTRKLQSAFSFIRRFTPVAQERLLWGCAGAQDRQLWTSPCPPAYWLASALQHLPLVTGILQDFV